MLKRKRNNDFKRDVVWWETSSWRCILGVLFATL